MADSTGRGRAASLPEVQRAVVSTGQLGLEAKDPDRARAEVRRQLVAWRGVLAQEETRNDSEGRLSGTSMTLRVPTDRFDEAMEALARLGKVTARGQQVEDVTTDVLDVEARVRAAERSIRQIERLLGRAEEIGDVISVESELARRQAALDSLKSQQAWLADQTSLSTISLTIDKRSGDRPEPGDDDGFLAGLGAGWTALGASATVLLTVVGAVLPFAVTLALLGVPVLLVLRRRGRVSGGSAPARSS